MVMDVISVKYKEHDVGAVSFNTETGIGSFEFESVPQSLLKLIESNLRLMI